VLIYVFSLKGNATPNKHAGKDNKILHRSNKSPYTI